MINVYTVRLDESTVEGLELVKRKEGLDTVDDVIRFFLKDYAAYNQDEEIEEMFKDEDDCPFQDTIAAEDHPLAGNQSHGYKV